MSLPAEPIERDIQRKVLEPQLTCRHWHIPVLCYRVCSRFEDFQPLKTFQKNISIPKLQRILRYFCSLVVACFGVAVSSQYPALGISVFGVPLHLLVRFYFSYPKNRNDWIRTNDTCALQDVRPLHHACGRVSS